MRGREVVLWKNCDPEWSENGEGEQVVAVFHGIGVSIRCDTAWGWVEYPHVGTYKQLVYDFPMRYSGKLKDVATMAQRALEEFKELLAEHFGENDFSVFESKRYDNLLGLFYPEFRNDEWVNYLEVEGRIG